MCYFLLHRFLPNNHNHIRRETHPLLRFHHGFLKQLSPLRLSAQLRSFVPGREQVARVFQPHQEVVGVGFALFVDRWEGGGVDINETAFAEKGFEFWDPAVFLRQDISNIDRLDPNDNVCQESRTPVFNFFRLHLV